jgi:DDE superfamily endonuclease
VVRRGQKPARSPPPASARRDAKKNSASILDHFQQLWQECLPAFGQQRTAERAQALSLSSLLCLGRHTVTGLLTTCGREFQDWSAEYRLFSRHRLPAQEIFSVVRRGVLAELAPAAPLSVALDDSLLRKTGTRIPGVSWRRDPLGPRFQTNLIRAQRVLQLSAAIPLSEGACRMTPLAFLHAPTPRKPSAQAATLEWEQYRQAARQASLPLLAVQQIGALRQALDAEPNGSSRRLHIFVDGAYTNQTVLKKLPPRSVLIGRIRKDAQLYFAAPPRPGSLQRGRPRHYGAPAPTPEQLRTDASVPWTSVEVSINGAPHQMRVKQLAKILWRTAGLHHRLQLVVIAPLSYRLRKHSKVLYRQPAFLICTDAELDLRVIVQGFVQRWDIEVNFREEKTLLGVGQAQVRNAQSVQAVPALQVASYALMLLSTVRAFKGTVKPDLLPPPKWAAADTPRRFSTHRAIHQLRAEVWGRALGLRNFSGFATRSNSDAKPEKFLPNLASAVLYANN